MIRSPAGFDGGDRIKRYLDYYQPSYGVMMLSAGQFSPALLFAAGEQGGWYDPSDLTTLFQDAAGTTPVTAVEQPVGRVLDKSGRGNHLSQSTSTARPVLSARVNLLTRTEAPSNAAWVSGGTSRSITTGITDPDGGTSAFTIKNTGVSAAFWYQTITVQSGAAYTNSVWLRRRSGTGSVNMFAINGQGGVGQAVSVTTTWTRFVAPTFFTNVASGSTGYMGLEIASANDEIDVWHPDCRPANAGVGLPAYQRVGAATSGSSTAAGNADYDTTGFPLFLRFDGTDDFLQSGTINPGSVDKAQVFAGVRKLSDAAQGVLAEWSATIASNNGTFLLAAPDGATATFGFDSKGTTQVDAVASGQTAPLTAVLSGLADISGDIATIRVNGAQADQDTGDQGTGNFLAYPLYIGSRAGTSLRFNGHLYSLIARFSATNLPDATIAQTEAWVAGKTGVSL